MQSGHHPANVLPAWGAAQSPSEHSPRPLHSFLPCSVHQMLSRLWWGELLTHPRKCLRSEQPRCPSSQSCDHRCLPHAGPLRDRVEGLQVSPEPLGSLQDVRPPSLSWGGRQRTGWGPGRACRPQRATEVGSKYIPYIRWCPTNHHCMERKLHVLSMKCLYWKEFHFNSFRALDPLPSALSSNSCLSSVSAISEGWLQ